MKLATMEELPLTDEEKDGQGRVKKVVEILKSHGIKMKIGGCGCCGSPWVSFEYNGEVIVDEVEYFILDESHYKGE